MLETCETAGVLAPAVVTVAAFQWTQAIKLLVGDGSPAPGVLLTVDVWSGDYEVVHDIPRRPDCACCVEGRYEHLDARSMSHATALCGRNVVQVRPGRPVRLDLPAFARRFEGIGTPVVNEFLVRVVVDSHELTVFDDGRAIIRGTDDPAEARSIYARWVGV